MCKLLKLFFIIMSSLSFISISYCDTNDQSSNTNKKQVEKEFLKGIVNYDTVYHGEDTDEDGDKNIYILSFLPENKIFLVSISYYKGNDIDQSSYTSTCDNFLKISKMIPIDETKGVYELVVNFVSQKEKAFYENGTVFDEDDDKDDSTYTILLFVSKDKKDITMHFPIGETPIKLSTEFKSDKKQ